MTFRLARETRSTVFCLFRFFPSRFPFFLRFFFLFLFFFFSLLILFCGVEKATLLKSESEVTCFTVGYGDKISSSDSALQV